MINSGTPSSRPPAFARRRGRTRASSLSPPSNGACVAKCLVIGGNGFLGSHVVDELVTAGHTVTVFDRFSHDGPSFTSPAVRAITGDFFATDDLRAAVDGQELLFHFLSTTTPV